MITDTHVHVFPPEVIRDWEKIARKETHFASLVRGKAHRWATVEDVIDSMRVTGIDESWIFGFAFEDQGLCRLCNDYVIDAKAIPNNSIMREFIGNSIFKELL